MIKVSVLYPSGADHKFDFEYYCNSHMPLCERLLGPALKGVAVERGLAGAAPGDPPAYMAMGHLLFDSVEAFQASFGAHEQEIVADIPNYTNSQPLLQISEVML